MVFQKHKFIERCKSGASAMLPKIEKAKQVRASMVLEPQNIVPKTSLLEDYGDTVPSKPQVVDAVPSEAILLQQAASREIGSTVEGENYSLHHLFWLCLVVLYYHPVSGYQIKHPFSCSLYGVICDALWNFIFDNFIS